MGSAAALVSGASGGIGNALCRYLASEGFDLTLSGRRAALLESHAAELSLEFGVQTNVVVADMAVEGDVERLISSHSAFCNRLDALVLCAGVGTIGDVEGYSLSRLDKQIAVNLRGPFQLVGGLLPLLRKTARLNPLRGAKIIAIASLAGVVSERGMAAYGASKAALISLCQTINLEGVPDGVTATALSPGFVDTDMTEWIRDRIDPSSMISVADITHLFGALLRLSPAAIVPNIVISRSGEQLWRV